MIDNKHAQSDNPDEERGLIEFLCRHLVALCVSYEPLSKTHHAPKTGFKAYSGTLICIGNTVCYFTAGHIIKQIDEAISNHVTIRTATLADTFGPRRASNHPIPFDLPNEPRFFIDDEDLGLDFGLIILRSYYVRLLAANGMIALSENNWIHQSKITFDGYFILGIPAELTSDQLPSTGLVNITPTLLRVVRLKSLPKGIRVAQNPQFIGQIDPGLPLKSLEGMSGGPIIGITVGPPVQYWIVALQSGWYPSQRIVVGSSLPVIGSLLTEWTNAQLHSPPSDEG